MELFRNVADLKDSGFLFRIVDNGGETYDRITVTFCDGDAILCSAGSICAHIERSDVQIDADDVESGTSRDLRWIDLDEGLRRRIIADLNEGYRYYIENEPAAATRDEARDWQGLWNEFGDDRTAIYREGDAFRIRDDERDDKCETDLPLTFDTFRDAVFYMLPSDYDLSGPEYFTTADLWDETDGPAPLWDRETDPPVIDPDLSDKARVQLTLDTGGDTEESIAWFATVTDAENYLGHSATIDPDHLDAGHYSIINMDDPDAG